MKIKKSTSYNDNLNFGIIGNCKSSALINEDSSIDWSCLPEFDSPLFHHFLVFFHSFYVVYYDEFLLQKSFFYLSA